MALTFYVLVDQEVPACVKVGKDTKWPQRFMQARCHSPGKIVTAATFQLPSTDRGEQEALDAEVRRVLAPYARDVSIGKARIKEWYNVTANEAVRLLLTVPQRSSSKVTINPPEILFDKSRYEYEDWRDLTDPISRWRAFLFQIVPPTNQPSHPYVGRLKLAAGSLYDTAYRYNFTYCAFPVALIGGFETSLEVAENNQAVVRAWESLVRDLGHGPQSQPMGWLRSGITPQRVGDAIEAYGCAPFSLTRPKPIDARPKDPSLKPTPIGATFPMNRVRDAYC